MMKMPLDLNFLIVEDVQTARDLLKKNLQQLGFTQTPAEAENVDSAMGFLGELIKDGQDGLWFILSDLNMPGKSGLDLLKCIRQDKRYGNLPFIMITSENNVNFMIDAVNLGCNNYIVKPWNLETLGRKLQETWDMLEEPVRLLATGKGGSHGEKVSGPVRTSTAPKNHSKGEAKNGPKAEANDGDQEKSVVKKVLGIFGKK